MAQTSLESAVVVKVLSSISCGKGPSLQERCAGSQLLFTRTLNQRESFLGVSDSTMQGSATLRSGRDHIRGAITSEASDLLNNVNAPLDA